MARAATQRHPPHSPVERLRGARFFAPCRPTAPLGHAFLAPLSTPRRLLRRWVRMAVPVHPANCTRRRAPYVAASAPRRPPLPTPPWCVGTAVCVGPDRRFLMNLSSSPTPPPLLTFGGCGFPIFLFRNLTTGGLRGRTGKGVGRLDRRAPRGGHTGCSGAAALASRHPSSSLQVQRGCFTPWAAPMTKARHCTEPCFPQRFESRKKT